MKMYRLTTEELEQIESMEMGERSKYNPIEDVNGDSFISEVEHNVCGLGVETEFAAPEAPPLEL